MTGLIFVYPPGNFPLLPMASAGLSPTEQCLLKQNCHFYQSQSCQDRAGKQSGSAASLGGYTVGAIQPGTDLIAL